MSHEGQISVLVVDDEPALAGQGIAPEHVFLKPQADLSAVAEAVRTLARRGRWAGRRSPAGRASW